MNHSLLLQTKTLMLKLHWIKPRINPLKINNLVDKVNPLKARILAIRMGNKIIHHPEI